MNPRENGYFLFNVIAEQDFRNVFPAQGAQEFIGHEFTRYQIDAMQIEMGLDPGQEFSFGKGFSDVVIGA